MGVPGPGAWLRILAGTRARGLAPLDLLLVAALLATLAAGAWARGHDGGWICRRLLPITPATPFLTFRDGTRVPRFDYADLRLPLGVPIEQIQGDPYPSSSIRLDDGSLHTGDRLLRVDRWDTVWGWWAGPHQQGAWLATGWTFVVLHGRTIGTYHLAQPCQ